MNLATGNVAASASTVGYEALGGTIGGSISYNSRAQDTGLRARMFNDSNSNGAPDDALVTQRTDREIRFSWANPSTVPGIGNFVGSWTGFFTPAATGVYKFGLAAGADDKAKIEVGSYWVQANQSGTPAEVKLDALLSEQVSSFEAQTNVAVSSTAGVTLTANVPYAVKITYSNPTGPGALGFYMTGVNPTAGSLYSVVPSSMLSPDAPILPAGWTFNHEEGFAAVYAQVLVETSQIVLTRTDGEKLTYLKKSDGGYTPPAGEDDVVTIAAGVVTITDTGGTVYKFKVDGQLETITAAVDAATPAAAVPSWTDLTTPTPMSRLTGLTDPISGRGVAFVYQGVTATACPAKAGYVTPGLGMLCQVNLLDGGVAGPATKLFYLQNTAGAYVLSRIEQPGDTTVGVPAIDYGYSTNGLLSSVRDALVNEAIDALPATANSSAEFTTNIGYDTNSRATSVEAPKAALGDTARQKGVVQYQGTLGAPTNETWVLVDGLDSPASSTDWDRKVTFDDQARVLLDYQAMNATSGQSMRTETRWDTLNDRPLVNISNRQASTSIYNYRGDLVTAYGPANESCFDLTNTSSTYRLPNGTCTTPPVARTDFEYDTSLNTNGTSSPFTNLAVSIWPNNTTQGKPNAKTTGFGGAPGTFSYNWGAGGPSGATAADFSFQANGEIRFPSTGTYTLEGVTGTDDAMRLYVDDQLIVDKPAGGTTGAGAYTVMNDTTLVDGTDHVRRVRVEFQDMSGNSAITLNWTPPSAAKVAIPIDRFRPRYSLKTRTTVATNDATNAPSQVTHTSYDATGVDQTLGLVTKVTEDPAGLKLETVTGYETAGYRRRTSRTLPAGNAYSYEFVNATASPNNAAVDSPCTTVNDTTVNQGGKLQYTTAPVAADGTALRTHTVYDTLGRTLGVRQGTRSGTTDTWEPSWACTSYDPRLRVSQVTVGVFGIQTGTRTITTNFKVGGNPLITSVTDVDTTPGAATTTVKTEADLLGRTLKYTDTWNQTSTTTYDKTTGRVSGTTGPVGPQTFTYDRAGRIIGQTLDGVAVATPTYETAGTVNEFALASVVYSNGTSVTNGRNATGAVTSLTWKQGATTLATDTVTKVQDGRTSANTLTWGATSYAQGYKFDAAGRLIRATIPGSAIDYNYATAAACTAAPSSFKNSNRSAVVTTPTGGSAATKSFCYDQADRLTNSTTGVTALSYDGRGNTTTVNSDVYSYDAANRHVKTVTAGTPGVLPVHRATTQASNGAGATTLSLTKPATAVVGDVLVASIAASDAGVTGSTPYTNGFEVDNGTWTPWSNGPTVAQSADTARTGTKSLKLTPGGGQSNALLLPPVSVGVPTTVTIWTKGTGSVQPYIQYYTANWAAQIGSATTPAFTLTSGAFSQWTFTYTPPANTAIVQFALQNFDANPWYVDDVTFTTGNTNAATSVTPPSGWTAVTANATPGVGLSTYTHVAAAADPVSWSFGLSQTTRAAGTIGAYSGVDTASPIDVMAVGTNVSGLSHAAPSVTTSGANRLGVTVNAITAATTFTPTAGSTERSDQTATATAPTAAIETADFPIATAGASGAKVSTSAAAGLSATATLTLRPASAGGTTTVEYVRDVTNRIVERKVNGATVARYTFSSSGDTPDAELDATNVVQRRTIGLMGGAVLSKATGSEIWSISNLHGDTIATLNAPGTVTGGPFTYDPYGTAIGGVPDNQIGSFDNGWLGQNQRPLEQQVGLRSVIEMGARIYDPILGRFLSVDPIEGGTANDYNYVEDPINQFDLGGTCRSKKGSWFQRRWCNGTKGFRKAALAESRIVGFAAYGAYYSGYRMNKVAAKAGPLGLHVRPLGWAMQVVGMVGDVTIDQRKQNLGIPETLLDEHQYGNLNPFHGASRDQTGGTWLPGLYNKDTRAGRPTRGLRSIRMDFAW